MSDCGRGPIGCSHRPRISRRAASISLPATGRQALFAQEIRYRHRLDLVPVLIHDGNPPSVPTAARHDLAVLEVPSQHHGLLPRRGGAGEVHALGVVHRLFAVGQMKIVTRHGALAPFHSTCVAPYSTLVIAMLRQAAPGPTVTGLVARRRVHPNAKGGPVVSA